MIDWESLPKIKTAEESLGDLCTVPIEEGICNSDAAWIYIAKEEMKPVGMSCIKHRVDPNKRPSYILEVSYEALERAMTNQKETPK